jgi:hypothetical protein
MAKSALVPLDLEQIGDLVDDRGLVAVGGLVEEHSCARSGSCRLRWPRSGLEAISPDARHAP